MSGLNNIIKKLSTKNHTKIDLNNIYINLNKDVSAIDSFKNIKLETPNLYRENFCNVKELVISINHIAGYNNRNNWGFNNWYDFFKKQSYSKLLTQGDKTYVGLNDYLGKAIDKVSVKQLPKVFLEDGKLIIDEGYHRLTLSKGLFVNFFFVELFYKSEEELQTAIARGIILKP